MESSKLLPNQTKRQPKISNAFFPIIAKARGRVRIEFFLFLRGYPVTFFYRVAEMLPLTGAN
jgi:hypothetical protein